MGHWGVKSYEIDEADDALDRGFDTVHGSLYEVLMDDRNPLSFEQVQQRLAKPETLDAAIAALKADLGDESTWDEIGKLAFAGIVVRHAELKVPISRSIKKKAIGFLEKEDLDWEREATKRQLRREREIALINKAPEPSTSTT